jgi:hypothetical protein
MSPAAIGSIPIGPAAIRPIDDRPDGGGGWPGSAKVGGDRSGGGPMAGAAKVPSARSVGDSPATIGLAVSVGVTWWPPDVNLVAA